MYISGEKFSFLNEKDGVIEEVFPGVYCKDFLTDAVYGTVKNINIEIYGFNFNPEVDKLDLSKTRLAFYSGNGAKVKHNKAKILDLLNQVEDELGYENTTIDEFEKGLIINGSKNWMAAPHMISLYTLLIRIGMYHTEGVDWQTSLNSFISGATTGSNRKKTDAYSARKIIKGIDKIKNQKLSENWEDNFPKKGIHEIHNNGFGFWSSSL